MPNELLAEIHSSAVRGETALRRVQWKLEKEYSKKYGIEENILKAAKEALISDKASAFRLKLLQ